MGVRRTAAVALVGVTAVTVALAGGIATARDNPVGPDSKRPKAVQVQLLALNDFHGNLEPNKADSSSGNVNGIPAGGAEYLATHLRTLRKLAEAEGKGSLTVAAGDLIGASPLLSAAFYDEPTIDTLSRAGLDVASIGNHEFDQGWRELMRKQKGGCIDDGDGKDNKNSCPDPKSPFQGADFRYLSANVFHEDSGDTLFKPYTIKRVKGEKVGFIGMTLEDTPNIVTQEGVKGLKFTDEVETANKLVPELKKKGVNAIVVLLHEGGFPADPTQFNGCPGISGPVVDIAKNLDPAIDTIVSGHTHMGYNCVVDDPAGKPRQVTSAASFGKLITELTLTIDRRTGEVIRDRTPAVNRIVTRDVEKAGDITRLLDKHREYVKPIANRVIGHLTTDTVSRTNDDSLESPLGNLIADAQLADETVVTGDKKPQIALMNPGGIRDDLVATDKAVTFGSAFTVQPFSNYLVSMDLTGEQLTKLLEQQWSDKNGGGEGKWKVLQVAGLSYTWKKSAPEGGKLVDGSVKVGDEALDPKKTYRVVANSFLSDGGDGFSVFTEAKDKYYGGLDIDGLATYLTANDPYTPVKTDRIGIEP